MTETTLSHADARAVYDRIGSWQDTQAFYEDRATNDLFAHAELGAGRTTAGRRCAIRRDAHANGAADRAREIAATLGEITPSVG
jgi:hypothetical protein